MNNPNLLLISLLLMFVVSAFGQNSVVIECETDSCSILNGKRAVPDNYLKTCKSNKQVPFITGHKEGYKSRSAILNNDQDTFYLEALKKIPLRDSNIKFIRVLDVSSNNELGDILGKWYATPALQNRGIDKGDIITDYRYFIESDQFKDLLHEGLEEFGYFENNSRSIIETEYSIIYLNADLRKITFNKTTQNKSEFGRVTLEIDWSFESPYTDERFHFLTTSVSDPLNIDRSRASYNNAIKDAIEYGLIDLFEQDAVNALLKLDLDVVKGKTNVETTIIQVPDKEKTLGNELQTVVRVQSSNDVISSGTIISNDGYIITDYAVSMNEDAAPIVTIDSLEYEAMVIASAEYYNLSLLKIDAKNLRPTTPAMEETIRITDKVYALSHSKIKLLNAYATSGRISGIRTLNGDKYYQTDLPLSSGNHGGAVVNENYDCIGIINRKLNDYLVEGIGFVTPIKIALEALNITLISE